MNPEKKQFSLDLRSMKPFSVLLTTTAAVGLIYLCGCVSSTETSPTSPTSSTSAPRGPQQLDAARLEQFLAKISIAAPLASEGDKKRFQALELCAPGHRSSTQISASTYDIVMNVQKYFDTQSNEMFSVAFWRTIEHSVPLGTDISLTLVFPQQPIRLATIHAILGEESSKSVGSLSGNPSGRDVVTWHVYGWCEFAVSRDYVVAVRGKTQNFQR